MTLSTSFFSNTIASTNQMAHVVMLDTHVPALQRRGTGPCRSNDFG
jgi:hypothetical protein